MKKNLLKTALFISIVIGMTYMSCKPGSFTEEDAMLLQSRLEREKLLLQDSLNKVNTMLLDSLDKNSEKITYTLSVIDASKSTLLKSGDVSGGAKGGLTGVSITLTQGTTVVTKTTSSAGLVMFDNLKKGLATLHVVLTGFSEINAVIDFSYYGISTNVNGGIQFGNVLPMIPLTGTSTGSIKGTVVCESDLTNKVPEIVPVGTKVIASVDPGSSALSGISGGIIRSISYDGLSLEALTDATGAFTMTVPGTSMGLNYSLRVSDFTVNQTLLMVTKAGVPVTGVQTVPTYFGSTFWTGSSAVPTVSPVIVTIGPPDYTFTAASATAVVSNPNGLDYLQTTNAGNYYAPDNYFYNVPVDNPAPGTGGSNAAIEFWTNSFGQVYATGIPAKGSGYATSLEGTTFTLPYIRVAAKAVVSSVNGTGGIVSWRVSNLASGQFYSKTNIDFYRTLGSGTGAILTLPTIYDNGSYLYFTTSTQWPSSPLGSNYAVGDEFTLAVKSGMSDMMTGKIHMTTGSVTAINVINDGTNYIDGKTDVVIAAPGVTGTTATAFATVVNGKIASIDVWDGGSNYLSAPTVTIINKVEKIQAVATANVNQTSGGNITGFTMVNQGNGYMNVPTVTLTTAVTGAGSGASAIAVLSGGSVSSLNLIYGGAGYTGINTPTSVKNAPSSTGVTVNGSGTTITYINLGTGKRSVEN
jgi:hypothetical protein